ncbi:hypothetical protein B296_00056894 [Ensete ventricosum]|uniref:Cytochrome b561 domain-containing protein n=1 Tax=Ensete ventricosum TaxID=4639 RepID=A0A426XTE3_ENSVE|nr:hypothetical protein B296_00056894 [Ensete ventricosum]
MQHRLTVRTEWTKPLELRPLRSRRRIVYLDRLLERRGDGRKQRGGWVDHLQRSWDREAVLPGGEELERVPAGPRQPAAGGQQLADRVAVIPPLPRLPAEHLAARAIPHLRRVVSDAGSRGFPARRWHGLLTMLGWGVLMPAGVIMARYFKHLDPLWFYSHISIQGIGFVLGLVGIIAGFNLDDDLRSTSSSSAVLKNQRKAINILVLQVMAFLVRPDKSSKIRRYWNWYHHYVGRAAIASAVANIFLGLSVAHEDGSWTVGYVIFLLVWVIASLLLEVKGRMKKDDLQREF